MKHIYIGKISGSSIGGVIIGSLIFLIAIGFLLYTILIEHSIGKGLFFFITLIILALALSQSQGIMIDFTKRFYQQYHGIFIFKFGQWEPLPAVTTVVLFDIKKRTFSDSRYQWTKTVQTEIIYRTALYNAQTDFALIVSNSSNRNTALKEAQTLSESLQIPLEIELKEG